MFRRRLTYANVASTLALVFALGGVGYAATLPAGSVDTPQLKNGAVTTPKLAAGAVTTKKVHDFSLRLRDFGGKIAHYSTVTIGSDINVPAWGCGGVLLNLWNPTEPHVVGSVVIGYVTDAQGDAAMDNAGMVVPTVISETSQGGAEANLVICARAGGGETVPSGSVFHYRLIGP